ncbi:dicarboxylate/amino acid:cation symporter [Limnoglobus roseus]|uniref:Dicarboxylate/amino acid:cation symporter n=1 Tax=Limnoglobus roseus TaxID=2598579 RepID=A0A5C1AGZ1_9BACT|nr:cation:dicarboxylase symporter family transporter [Limnoglobus roseus]QEL18689.1 dicarboxylate/amino acid:cation symporter [Limnoglobus roseus]
MIKFLRNLSLTHWILISMALGTLIGWAFPDAAQYLKPLSTIFLRMIKSLIAPLIFATLVVGIAGHGDDMKRVGRLALKSLIYFEIVTTLALFIGLAAVNLTRPGVGVPRAVPTEKHAEAPPRGDVTFSEVLEHMVPVSVFEAAAKNEVLQIVFWSVLFGAALTQVPREPQAVMLHAMEALAETMFKFTGMVMKYAPVGIGAAIAVTVGHSGIQVLLNLLYLILTLYAALFAFMVFVLLPAAMWARIPLRKFGRAVKEPALIAFSTTSSEAALPKAMLAMQGIGVPKRIVAFVMPTGYSFNLDGTTLYLAVASIFACQVIGKEMSFGEQLVMMLTLMLTSKGVAGVPRASLVILSGTLASSAKLPPEDVALVLGLIMGVDELMDMARTTVNLIGNCLATCVMARWEGEFDDAATGVLAAESNAPQTPPPTEVMPGLESTRQPH